MTARRLAGILLAAAAAAWLVPDPRLKEAFPLSQAVFDRDGRLLRLTLAADQRFRLWLPLPAIAPAAAEAALLQEDRWFRWHLGVNPVSMARGAWRTYVKRDRRIGASTITMQVARLRWRLRSSAPKGKVVQILRALQLELKCSKREILEAYLNLVPMGGNVEGVGAASLIYLGKDAGRLTEAEAIALAVIPKNPLERGLAEDRPAPRIAAARRELLRRRLEAGGGPPEDEVLAVAARPRALAFAAPHLAEAVAREHPGEPVLRTTLDRRLQSALERGVSAFVESRRAAGIRNAAAMLVDYSSQEVVALVGSAGYFDESILGQVNAAKAKRSPGSALKPLLYGLAIDQGLIHPLTVLKDTPASFGGFNPENFDREFLGPVSAKDALIRSRNVPAVWLAARVKDPSLHGLLLQAGVSRLKSERHYGLALALGGAELTMEELVRLYAALANGGVARPLRWLKGEPEGAGRRILSEDASFLVLDMLKDAARPGRPWRPDWTADAAPVHWKTGTSFGFRDAWSVGIFGRYVLAVWVGNFDGEPNPAFVGIEAAAPLFFQLVDAVKGENGAWRRPVSAWAPKNLARARVCAATGQVPGPHCRHTAETWFVAGRSPIARCEVHREVLVDGRSGLRTCREGAHAERRVFEYWPSDLLRIFQQAGIRRRSPPADGPDCGDPVAAGVPPQITSPAKGVSLALRARNVGTEAVPLAAVTDADAREVHWFADDRYLGKSEPGRELLWRPGPGEIALRAVDDRGRSDVRLLRVEVVP